jgi:hypothetical protein
LLPESLKQKLESTLPRSAYTSIRAAWRHFLRLKKEGYRTAFERRRLWPKILETPPLFTNATGAGCDVTVHLMCHRGDYMSAIWALKSFYYHSESKYALTIHVQGCQSTPIIENRLREHFPNARVILQQEANHTVETWLAARGFHRLLEMRRALPIIQKLTDILILADSPKILMLDADVLFFGRPTELMDHEQFRQSPILFQQDFMDAYNLSRSTAKADLGVDLQPRINTGIVILSRELVDLEKCEEYLCHPSFAALDGHSEQTLYALEASRKHAVSYLPESYLVSFGGPVDCARLKARHYAGTSRPLLTREGIPYLLRSGFIQGLNKDFASRRPQLVGAGVQK